MLLYVKAELVFRRFRWAQMRLHIRAISPEPSLLVHGKVGTYRQTKFCYAHAFNSLRAKSFCMILSSVDHFFRDQGPVPNIRHKETFVDSEPSTQSDQSKFCYLQAPYTSQSFLPALRNIGFLAIHSAPSKFSAFVSVDEALSRDIGVITTFLIQFT